MTRAPPLTICSKTEASLGFQPPPLQVVILSGVEGSLLSRQSGRGAAPKLAYVGDRRTSAVNKSAHTIAHGFCAQDGGTYSRFSPKRAPPKEHCLFCFASGVSCSRHGWGGVQPRRRFPHRTWQQGESSKPLALEGLHPYNPLTGIMFKLRCVKRRRMIFGISDGQCR